MSGSIPQQPGAAAPPGAGSPPQQGQPPIGSSPATGPTQNTGMQAKALQGVGVLLSGMASAIQALGPTSPIGQALTKAMMDIGKHVPPGSVTPEGEMNFIKQLAMKAQQMAPQRAAMASQGGPPPGAMPPPGAGAAPPPPPPPDAGPPGA